MVGSLEGDGQDTIQVILEGECNAAVLFSLYERSWATKTNQSKGIIIILLLLPPSQAKAPSSHRVVTGTKEKQTRADNDVVR